MRKGGFNTQRTTWLHLMYQYNLQFPVNSVTVKV